MKISFFALFAFICMIAVATAKIRAESTDEGPKPAAILRGAGGGGGRG